MLKLYFNVYNMPPRNRSTRIYNLKDYKEERSSVLDGVSINAITGEIDDKFYIVGAKVNLHTSFVIILNLMEETAIDGEINFSFEKTPCKLISSSLSNTISFGCFQLEYTNVENIYTLFNQINEDFEICRFPELFLEENLKDLFEYKNRIDNKRKEVKELVSKCIQSIKINELLSIIDLDNNWFRSLFFEDFDFGKREDIKEIIENKKNEINKYKSASFNILEQNLATDVIKYCFHIYI